MVNNYKKALDYYPLEEAKRDELEALWANRGDDLGDIHTQLLSLGFSMGDWDL